MMIDLIVYLESNGILASVRELINAEVIKMTTAFLIAARMHRSWVRKDMEEQFTHITKAINNVADTVSRDLASHSKRIDDLSSRVENLERDSGPSHAK